jgi:hypothetical protein
VSVFLLLHIKEIGPKVSSFFELFIFPAPEKSMFFRGKVRLVVQKSFDTARRAMFCRRQVLSARLFHAE